MAVASSTERTRLLSYQAVDYNCRYECVNGNCCNYPYILTLASTGFAVGMQIFMVIMGCSLLSPIENWIGGIGIGLSTLFLVTFCFGKYRYQCGATLPGGSDEHIRTQKFNADVSICVAIIGLIFSISTLAGAHIVCNGKS